MSSKKTFKSSVRNSIRLAKYILISCYLIVKDLERTTVRSRFDCDEQLMDPKIFDFRIAISNYAEDIVNKHRNVHDINDTQGKFKTKLSALRYFYF